MANVSSIEQLIESTKMQIKGLDMQIASQRKTIEDAQYQISHRRAGAQGNDSDRKRIQWARERIAQINEEKKRYNAQLAHEKELLRKAKAEESAQKTKEKEREKLRREEEKEREKRAKEAEREQAKRIKATERENVNASKQQSLQGSLASLLQFYAGAALAETAANQVKSSSKPSQPKPQTDLNAIVHQVEAERAQAKELENRVRIKQAAIQATKVDPDDEYLRVYNDYCLKLYIGATENIKQNKNVSPDGFTEYYKRALYWQGGPRSVEKLEELANQLAPQVKSESKRSQMDGKIDLSILFHPECIRLENLVLSNKAYWNHPDIRHNFPELCKLGEQHAMDEMNAVKEAEKRQPLFVLLCFVAALICIPMIFNGINLIVLIITSAFVGCLYFLYKKFELTKCRDWNLIHVWKRFKQNKDN